MLYSLKIENIAIIEQAEISFSPGLNVLTGETGAGKSIIIDSINAVLGERTSRELIRSGAQSARVTAVFENVSQQVKDDSPLRENGEMQYTSKHRLWSPKRRLVRDNP